MAFYFKNTKKDIIMTEEDEDFKKNDICRYCAKNIESGKVRDHCHLTGKYRGRLITFVILMLLRNKVILFHWYYTILVFMLVIYFLKS